MGQLQGQQLGLPPREPGPLPCRACSMARVTSVPGCPLHSPRHCLLQKYASFVQSEHAFHSIPGSKTSPRKKCLSCIVTSLRAHRPWPETRVPLSSLTPPEQTSHRKNWPSSSKGQNGPSSNLQLHSRSLATSTYLQRAEVYC